MLMANTSAIQVWTLIIAGLAAVFSVAGIALTAIFARKSEQQVWLRDLRVRTYGECGASSEAYIVYLANLAAREEQFKKTGSYPDIPIENGTGLLASFYLSRSDVRTFGHKTVIDSVEPLFEAISAAQTATFQRHDDQTHQRVAARSAVRLFRAAVRESLKIDKD
jgi:hypothetical protein